MEEEVHDNWNVFLLVALPITIKEEYGTCSSIACQEEQTEVIFTCAFSLRGNRDTEQESRVGCATSARLLSATERDGISKYVFRQEHRRLWWDLRLCQCRAARGPCSLSLHDGWKDPLAAHITYAAPSAQPSRGTFLWHLPQPCSPGPSLSHPRHSAWPHGPQRVPSHTRQPSALDVCTNFLRVLVSSSLSQRAFPWWPCLKSQP